MEGPVCLIENTSAGDLLVNEEALVILSSIRQPVVVVSIVGMYRTGKSYLMNRLAGKCKGFSVGSTIRSVTKGIWMWCVPQDGDDRTLVLLDTEGLGDVEKGDQKNETWLFALAILLSSTLIYNSMGTINNEALMSLHYVTELTNHIKLRSTAEGEKDVELAGCFPSFVWALRDFMLELDLDGQTVTADEYLENSLRIKAGNNQNITISNAARSCIKKYFPCRKCFVFDPPTSKENLKTIEQLSDDELAPAFVEQILEFCDYISHNARVKIVKGEAVLTGRMLGNLVKIYVKTIMTGDIPCLENAVMALAKIENQTALEQSFALYRQNMEQQVNWPTDTEKELHDIHRHCQQEALQLFRTRSFKDDDQQYQNELKERIKTDYTRTREENERRSLDHCIVLLEELWRRIDTDSFMKPNGYRAYTIRVQSIIKEYKALPRKGVMADGALQKFMDGKADLENSIRKADEELTEQENRTREERLKHEQQMLEIHKANEQHLRETVGVIIL
ncbi:hypothetical protein AGOR_G00194190 [Albula goreensis]|uniref:GB1/RHD3-type G domain-containing protein n=1 Tax=Albula goreensis TaxID=1534307 RepID=A0A8T3CVN1_9TELE|nr:hypothetical protein AGOR_G00194190 [Albula goreensis]